MQNQQPSDCLIYKLDLVDYTSVEVELPDGARWVSWCPDFRWPLYCTRFPYWYSLFWFFHYFGLFRNEKYQATLLQTGNRVDAAHMIVPAWIKWPFMARRDVQIIYVVTHPSLLRQGLSKRTILYSLNKLKVADHATTVWYVTTSDNIASQKLCTSIGFRFAGYGMRKTRFGFYKTLQLIA